MHIWHLYLIRCRDRSLYTGITTDISRRFGEHSGKGKNGAKYLRGKGPLVLEFKRKIGSKSLASRLEYRVKQLPRADKEKLISGKIKIKRLLAEIISR
jgi:putative endonuclease